MAAAEKPGIRQTFINITEADEYWWVLGPMHVCE